VAWRGFLVREVKRTKKGKGATHPKPQKRNASFLPVSEEQGYPEAEV
jgi:hypothetical protein